MTTATRYHSNQLSVGLRRSDGARKGGLACYPWRLRDQLFKEVWWILQRRGGQRFVMGSAVDPWGVVSIVRWSCGLIEFMRPSTAAFSEHTRTQYSSNGNSYRQRPHEHILRIVQPQMLISLTRINKDTIHHRTQLHSRLTTQFQDCGPISHHLSNGPGHRVLA